MQIAEPARERSAEKRMMRWLFEKLDTLPRTPIGGAGHRMRPQGKLTLTLKANPTVQNALLCFLQA